MRADGEFGRWESVIIGIDDTDDVTKETSTGSIAAAAARELESLGGVVRWGITRHQLLLRDDIPYTSHNSSMVFEARLPAGCVAEARRRAVDAIAARRASASDPGLCVARVPEGASDGAEAPRFADEGLARRLVAFGRRAQREFCSIDEAYALAAVVPWVTLSQHGGDGAGVVGALAGVGLRLGGDDGRFRGKWDLRVLCAGAEPGGSTLPAATVAACVAAACHGPVRLVDLDGGVLPPDAPVVLASQGKPMLRQGALAFACAWEGDAAVPCAKEDLAVVMADEVACRHFQWDNDVEETIGSLEGCCNCLHRRWRSWGFSCMHPAAGAAI